jgi:phenylacetic acid degradation operon negative regulatory protein
MTIMLTIVSATVAARAARRDLSRGRSALLVPFLFGVANRDELPGPVLVRLLGDLGLTPAATRALIARLRAEGNLAGAPEGRLVRYRLDGDVARGFERIRHRPPPSPWPGHFHALIYQVPEGQRPFRDQLRRTALLAGFGLMAPGVLISIGDRYERLVLVRVSP